MDAHRRTPRLAEAQNIRDRHPTGDETHAHGKVDKGKASHGH